MGCTFYRRVTFAGAVRWLSLVGNLEISLVTSGMFCSLIKQENFIIEIDTGFKHASANSNFLKNSK